MNDVNVKVPEQKEATREIVSARERQASLENRMEALEKLAKESFSHGDDKTLNIVSNTLRTTSASLTKELKTFVGASIEESFSRVDDTISSIVNNIWQASYASLIKEVKAFVGTKMEESFLHIDDKISNILAKRAADGADRRRQDAESAMLIEAISKRVAEVDRQSYMVKTTLRRLSRRVMPKALYPGARVVLVEIKKPGLNKMTGTVVRLEGGSGRYGVSLVSGEQVAVKRCNLQFFDSDEEDIWSELDVSGSYVAPDVDKVVSFSASPSERAASSVPFDRACRLQA